MPDSGKPGEAIAKNKNERIDLGKKVYMQSCFACHQANGEGVNKSFPPLAKSDYLNADVNRAIRIVLEGLSGEITVNGIAYNSIMPSQQLTDEEIANVLTFIYNNWGNNGKEVTPDMVKSQRKK